MLLFLAGMFPTGMIVLMMIAMHIGVKLERICKIGADRAVRAAGYSPKQPGKRSACPRSFAVHR